MKAIRTRRPSPALFVACLALLVALGGTGYAAFKLPAGSVGARQLKKGAVVNKKIAPSAVTGAKVKNDSLTGADIVESSLGKVSSASSADSAGNAAHASRATTADNAVAVDGYAANGLTRVAEVTSKSGLALTSSYQTFGSALSITAPAPGFVLITGWLRTVSTTCTYACEVLVYVRHLQDGSQSDTSVGNFSQEPGSTVPLTAVFRVAAGVNTFDLQVSKGPANGTSIAVQSTLGAIFSPFSSTGGSALGSTK